MQKNSENKILQAQCREILERSEPALLELIEEIKKEYDGRKIDGDTSFEYAKQVIRNQGVQEGLGLLMKKINTYASR